MPAPSPPVLRDPARLDALDETGLLDALPEEAFDRLTRLVARVIGVPVALVSLVGDDRQVFKSLVGLPEPWASQRQTPLSHSFCQHVVGRAAPFVVEDARTHPVTQGSAAIDDLGVVAYAGVPLTTPEGHVLGSLCAIDDQPRAWTDDELDALRDLGAMTMTQIALRRSERRYRLLTEYASDMISTHALDGRYLYASPAARALLGYEPDALVGRQAYDFFHPDDIPAIEAAHAATIGNGARAYTTRYRIRRADDTYVWVETRGQLTPGDVVAHGIVAVTRDVTAQKAAEDALVDEREQFETLSEAIPQQVWTALPDGSLDYVSHRLAAYFDRSKETILGAGWVDVIHPDDVGRTVERWTHSLETGAPYEVEFRLRAADGAYRWHLGRALPQLDADGAVVRWFGTNTDITDRKGLEAALETERARLEGLLASLRRAQAQLLQQEKLASLGRVTAGIAHEIKNPLNFVINFGEIIVGLTADLRADTSALGPAVGEAIAELADNAERVVHHGRRADRIAQSMLALARTDAPAHRPADLNAVVAEHVALACGERERRRGHRVAVETDLDPAVGQVAMDDEAIGRVVVNLVQNALDATYGARAEGAPTPELRVSTRRTGRAVEVRVADNGPGIAADVLPHIFEPFYTTKPSGEGTGLGLSIAHETVVQAHRGDLTVRTEPGGGAVFTVSLPVSPERPAA